MEEEDQEGSRSKHSLQVTRYCLMNFNQEFAVTRLEK